MMNLKDIPTLEAELSSLQDGPGKTARIDEVTGPAVGLVWDDDAKKINIAEGWAPDLNGNILNIDDATGPATGMILRDGVIVPV